MVKLIMKVATVQIPEKVTLSIKNKVVTCEGPLGKIVRSFRKFNVQLIPSEDAQGRITEVAIRVWFAGKAQKACVSSTKTHLTNMVTGVTKGFVSVMKYGNKFFPMTVSVNKNNAEIVKFAGRLHKYVVKPVEGVKFSLNPNATAREVLVSGIDKDSVGKTCGVLGGTCKYRKVDRRVFIDGIYPFDKTHMLN